MISFKDVFNTKKQKIIVDTIYKRALEEHWCYTCRHCEYERDGDWCKFRKTVANGPCLFYDLDLTKV